VHELHMVYSGDASGSGYLFCLSLQSNT
jgi:hypothetical protein